MVLELEVLPTPEHGNTLDSVVFNETPLEKQTNSLSNLPHRRALVNNGGRALTVGDQRGKEGGFHATTFSSELN